MSDLSDLLAKARKVDAVTEKALRHAQRLAVALHDRHYPGVKNWKVGDNLLLVIDQIDNMTAGLEGKIAYLKSEISTECK